MRRPLAVALVTLGCAALTACSPTTGRPDASPTDARVRDAPLDDARAVDATGDDATDDAPGGDVAPVGEDATPPPPHDAAPPPPTEPYYRAWESVPVASCGAALEQRDQVITLAGGRPVLLTTWLPTALYGTNAGRAVDLVHWADRSMCSTSPLSSSCSGLMSTGVRSPAQVGYGDYVVVTPRLLLWFDLTSAHRLDAPSQATPNGGGGMLRGVWTLGLDGSGHLNFTDIRNGANWAPNVFMPGAIPSGRGILQGSGLSAFITDVAEDTGVTYNLENDANVALAIHAPSSTVEGGAGTLHAEGFLVQTLGRFVDTRPTSDRYRLGRAGTTGAIRALTTYRFAACDDHVFLETIWHNESPGRVGPVVNLLIATNTWGQENHGSYSANLVDFSETSPETCVARVRAADTPGCHTGREDYMALAGREHEYRARASVVVPPPTMVLRGRDGAGGATPWALGARPLSGVVSAGVIFDLHSLCFSTGCELVSAHDLTVFNTSFWTSPDARIRVADPSRLPPGIEQVGSEYFIAGGADLVARVALQFAR